MFVPAPHENDLATRSFAALWITDALANGVAREGLECERSPSGVRARLIQIEFAGAARVRRG